MSSEGQGVGGDAGGLFEADTLIGIWALIYRSLGYVFSAFLGIWLQDLGLSQNRGFLGPLWVYHDGF